MEPISDLLRKWRTEREFSLRSLSQQAAIGKSTLSDWERGKAEPRLHELERVLSAMGVSQTQRKQALGRLEAPGALQRLAREGDSPPVAGDMLRAMRVRCGMTQERAAQLAGASQSMIARWERSEDRPSEERLHALCRALGAHPEETVALLCGRFVSSSPLKPPFDNDALNLRRYFLTCKAFFTPHPHLGYNVGYQTASKFLSENLEA